MTVTEERDPKIYLNYKPPKEKEEPKKEEEAPKPMTKLEIWKERQRKQAEG